MALLHEVRLADGRLLLVVLIECTLWLIFLMFLGFGAWIYRPWSAHERGYFINEQLIKKRVAIFNFEKPFQIQAGDLILVKAKNESNAIRRVGCVAGQQLDYERGQWFCDGVGIGEKIIYNLNKNTENHKVVEDLNHTTIAQNYLFVITDKSLAESVDSRLSGLLNVDEVLAFSKQ